MADATRSAKWRLAQKWIFGSLTLGVANRILSQLEKSGSDDCNGEVCEGFVIETCEEEYRNYLKDCVGVDD